VVEWQEAVGRLQSEVDARPLKADVDAAALRLERQVKLLSRRLSRRGSTDDPGAAAAGGRRRDDETEQPAAGMKKQLVSDFSCLSCDKRLRFAPRDNQCVVVQFTVRKR